jgi:malate dehydrogenase
MKISLIGAGQIGATLSHLIANSSFVDELAIFDIKPNLTKAIKNDLNHCLALKKKQLEIKVSESDYSIIKDSDIIVITASVARPVTMENREELLGINSKILSGISENIKQFSPSSIIIVVSNPLDLMTYLVWKKSGFAGNKILGMGCGLDQARYEFLLAEKLGCNVSEIVAVVMGEHGENLMILPELTLIKGKKLTELLPANEIEEIIEKTKKAGLETGNLYGSSPWMGPAYSILKIIKSIVGDKKEVISVSTILDGEYGIKNTCIGVPVTIGKNGVEKIITLKFEESTASKFAEIAAKLYEKERKLNI